MERILIPAEGPWRREAKWNRIAYVAKSREGRKLCVGCFSTAYANSKVTSFIAANEAILKAWYPGFTRIVLRVRSKEM
jgi:predicted deacetylase